MAARCGGSKCSLRLVLRNLWLIVSLLAVACIPILVWQLHQSDKELHVFAWFIAGLFVVVTVPLSILEVTLHLYHYTQPRIQRYVIRILWMVPIYAIDAWFSLRFEFLAKYIQLVREMYEAYVIYSFLFFLIASLGSEGQIAEVLRTKRQQRHIFPFCCIKDWRMGRDFLTQCKHGVLSYTCVRIVTAIIIWITQIFDVYKEGNFSPKYAYVYVCVINNLSQLYAMYCLIIFYKVLKHELAPIKPLGKFLCIKAVVFFTFWQSVGIAVFVQLGIIRDKEEWTHYDTETVAQGLQDFLICVEMFFACIAHLYAFSHSDYVVEYDALQEDSEQELMAFPSPDKDVHVDDDSVWEGRDIKEEEQQNGPEGGDVVDVVDMNDHTHSAYTRHSTAPVPARMSFCESVCDMFKADDVRQDIVFHVSAVGRKVKKAMMSVTRIHRRRANNSAEGTEPSSEGAEGTAATTTATYNDWVHYQDDPNYDENANDEGMQQPNVGSGDVESLGPSLGGTREQPLLHSGSPADGIEIH